MNVLEFVFGVILLSTIAGLYRLHLRHAGGAAKGAGVTTALGSPAEGTREAGESASADFMTRAGSSADAAAFAAAAVGSVAAEGTSRC